MVGGARSYDGMGPLYMLGGAHFYVGVGIIKYARWGPFVCWMGPIMMGGDCYVGDAQGYVGYVVFCGIHYALCLWFMV